MEAWGEVLGGWGVGAPQPLSRFSSCGFQALPACLPVPSGSGDWGGTRGLHSPPSSSTNVDEVVSWGSGELTFSFHLVEEAENTQWGASP